MPATALDGAFSGQNPNAHQEHYDQEGNKPEYELCHNGKPWAHMCWKPMTALPVIQIREIYLVARLLAGRYGALIIQIMRHQNAAKVRLS